MNIQDALATLEKWARFAWQRQQEREEHMRKAREGFAYRNVLTYAPIGEDGKGIPGADLVEDVSYLASWPEWPEMGSRHPDGKCDREGNALVLVQASTDYINIAEVDLRPTVTPTICDTKTER